MRLGSYAALLATIFLAACTGSMSFFQRALIWETGFSVTSAIAYGDGERQKLDIYTPRGAPPRATVMFVYGGSWTSGNRSLYRFLGQALAGRGYQVVVPDYRLAPAHAYPDFVEDTARAFSWVKSHIGEHGGDPARVILMGHSAGAYNVAMIAIDPNWLAPYGLTPGDALGVMSLAGPLSFNPLKTESTRPIFAGAADIDSARPIKLAASGAAGAPPFLLVHGTGDTTVGVFNSQNFADAVNTAGGRAALKTYDGAGHLTVVTCFAWPLRWKAPCLDDADAFFTSLLL